MRADATLLVALAVLGVGYLAWPKKSTASATTTPSSSNKGSGAMSMAACATIVANLPPAIQAGAVAAGQKALGTSDPNDPMIARKVNDAIAAYFVANNYPGVAKCLQDNPPLMVPTQFVPPAPKIPAPANCAAVIAALPPDVASHARDVIGAIKQAFPQADPAAVALQASATLDALGYPEAAACLRNTPTIFDTNAV